MKPIEEIKNYSTLVSTQIRWKKVKPQITKEIENHLYDQHTAYISDNYTEEVATKKAIAQMGDAISLGKELNKMHKPKPQFTLIFLSSILMIIGLFSNHLINVSSFSLPTFSIFPYIIGFFCFIVCYFMDFTLLGKYSKQCYFTILICSIISIFLGDSFNGRLLLNIGGFSFALFYLTLIFPLVYSLFIYDMKNKGYLGLFYCGLGYLPLALILLFIPTLSGFFVFTLSALILLCFAICQNWFGIDKKYGFLLVLVPTLMTFIISIPFILRSSSFRLDIFKNFINPYQDRYGGGYVNSLIRDFLSQSLFWGQGSIPQNISGLNAIPCINTDLSLLYFIYHLGFVVLFIIVFIIVLFSILSFHKAMKQKSFLGRLLTISILLVFLFQSILYIMSNLGYGLGASFSLPFISYGDTSFVINCILIGFMLSIFRTGYIYSDNPILHPTSNQFFTYHNGKLIIDFHYNKLVQ